MYKFDNILIQYGSKTILQKDNLEFSPGNIIGIYGKSGSGKTSLLKMLCLDQLFGHPYYDHEEILDIIDFKFNHISFIDDQFHLLPNLSCYEILEFALYASNLKLTKEELIKRVGLKINQDSYPRQLSYGQKALFSLAYTIAKNDNIIILDEILGPLDYNEREKVFTILNDIKEDKYIFVSYLNEDYDQHFDAKLVIKNQTIEYEFNHESNRKSNIESKKKINKKLLFKSYFKNHLTTKIITIIMMSCFIAFGNIMYHQSSYLIEHIGRLSKMIEPSYYSVSYDKLNLLGTTNIKGMDEKLIDEISQLDCVEKIYPAMHFNIQSHYNYSKGYPEIDQDIYKIFINGEQKELCQYSSSEVKIYEIAPYIDHHLDNACDKINENGTIYLSADTAKLLQITDVSKNINLKFHVLVPIDGYEVKTVAVVNDKEIPFEQQISWFNNIEIEATLRGVLSPYYPANEQQDILMPQEEMYKIYLDNLKEDSKYKIANYIIQTSNQEEIKQDIQRIDSSISCKQEGEMIIDSWKKMNANNELFNQYIYIIFAFIIGIGLLINLYENRINKQYFKYIQTIGVNKKQIRSIRIKKLFYTVFIYFALIFVSTAIIVASTKNTIPVLYAINTNLNKEIIQTSMISGVVMFFIMNISAIFDIVRNK